MLQLQTVLQTLAPTLGIERAGEQLQTVQVWEGRKNEFHVEPMVHKAEYPLLFPDDVFIGYNYSFPILIA